MNIQNLRRRAISRPNLEGAGISHESSFDRELHALIAEASGGFSPMGLAEAWIDWGLHLAVSPMRQLELVADGCREASHGLDLVTRAMAGEPTCIPCERSLPQDRRFRAESWQRWPFALYAETFLGIERWWDSATRNIHGATKQHLEMLNFVGRQALDVIAPSNFVQTNPDVLDATTQQMGMNLVRGTQSALADLASLESGRRSAADEVYEPGKTVAMTKGDVVHTTPLAEIIQYRPTTQKVRPEPIVIVPAWIMKYYILDLEPENSLIKHLVDGGFAVFVISWKNPGLAERDIDFDDYRRLGVLPALKAAMAITGAERVHGVGYCIGGTLLAIVAASAARDNNDCFKSLTFLAAQTDFTDAGELKLFVDESQLALLEDVMWQQGTLKASQMAGTFHLLRSNDLIWSRVIQRYLLGKPEQATSISAWSSDATRMPYRMHSNYLRQLYLNNDLAEGRFYVDGEAIALPDIRTPIFAVGTEWDHVAPWRSVYRLHLLTESEITFVLADKGHNQGIVSPPGRKERHFRLKTSQTNEHHIDADSWADQAELRSGSWWLAWFDWLNEHSSLAGSTPPTGRADLGFAAIREAPGNYVHG